MSGNIICPNCKIPIEITEVMSAQLRASIRNELDAELNATRERLKAQQQELDRKAETVEQQVQAKLNEGRQLLERKIRDKAKEELAVEMKDRDVALVELQTRVQQASQKELAFLKERRDLEE